ncbi:MAG: hypothetical protein ACLP2F_01940 [Steroidobacteraceae bacterium]
MSDDSLRSDVNFRSEGFFIARAMGTCRCCRASTRMLALALPPEHETLALDPEAECEESAQDTWQVASCNAFLFYIEYLPDAVRRRLTQLSPFYRFARSAATQGSYWANHCERCGSLLDDQDLFCEPEGAFLPTNDASAADIQLLWIDEPIEAAAAGYACDPEFFASMGGP